jgi:hypothetical protein
MYTGPKKPPLTTSEKLFESFLESNSLVFERIPPATIQNERRPDYKVFIADQWLVFEITEITADKSFGQKVSIAPLISSSTRTLGDHIRTKISEKKKQIQWGIDRSMPSILIIHNKLDSFQMFGTEETDFIAAMYGEYTLNIKKDGTTTIFNGRNQTLRESLNTSFSALGFLYQDKNQLRVILYENVFAALKVPYDQLPPPFEVKRFALPADA